MGSFSLIHTADWHLGKMVREYRREGEFRDALDQLYQHLQEQAVDLLLIAGDVFDSALPPTWAQNLYFTFLARLQQLSHPPTVIITAGNHDSALLLEAHKNFFHYYGIYVVSGSSVLDEEQLILVNDDNGALQAIVLAVPYLRDAQMRSADVRQDLSGWKEQLHEAMHAHYAKLIARALALRGELPVPIIAMGHLFMVGGCVNTDDGMRMSVGTLGEFYAHQLFDQVDYVALGHLHQPQVVNKQQYMRYSGSLLKSAFSEMNHQKSIVKVEFSKGKFDGFTLLPIIDSVGWCSLHGTLEEINQQLLTLQQAGRPYYVELCIRREDLAGARSLQEHYEGQESIIKVIQLTRIDQIEQGRQLSLEQSQELLPLSELQPRDVFLARLEREGEMEITTRTILIELFERITKSVQEEG